MDYQYWNKYYNKKVAPSESSKFAKDILSFLKKEKKLVELGCGNGRDSVFFARHGINVVALDQADSSILDLTNNKKNDNIEFVCDDFVNSNILNKDAFNYSYSRFTIHSISDEDEKKLLKRVYFSLKEEGMFFIEVRSVKDDLYGLGEEVGRNAYVYNEHYRRFIVMDELIQNLETVGFKIISAQESNNCAIYKDSNPIVIRIIAQK